MTDVTWSVTIQASGDRTLGREEIVELADAVIAYDGVASGIGSTTYGVQILLEAPTRDGAAERAREIFASVVAKSGLPAWPISRLEPMSQQDELEELLAEQADAGEPE